MTEAERTIASIAAMLGWMNVPPRETLEADIRALKARVQASAATEMQEARRWHTAFNAALRRVTMLTPPVCDGPDCAICQIVSAHRDRAEVQPSAQER
jgi:hypothetical protein